MTIIFQPGVPVGQRSPWLSGDQALATRVRMVLETRPGQMPWRPTFGCDLARFVGRSATGTLLNDASSTVRNALETWLPDVKVEAVNVKIVPAALGPGGLRHRTVPVAESSILTLGVQCSLHLSVDLIGPDGPTTLTATVEP